MAATKRVMIGPSTFSAVGHDPLDRLKQAGMDVIMNPYGRKLTKPELQALLPGVVGLIAGLEPLSRDVLERSDLKVISRCGAGLSNVDLEAARDLRIKVTSTPDAPTTAVAELTVGAAIALMRHLSQMDRDLHQGRWFKRIGGQLEGRTVLIIGLGRIGRRVAMLLRPFNARLLAVDPARSAPAHDVEMCSMRAGLAQADLVTLHASGEAEILGDREFENLKPGAFLLNVARGALVNEAALCRALDANVVAGAWLDTFSEEPYDGPLIKYSQVILTPHIGSSTVECRRRMEMEAVENLLAALADHHQ